MERFRESLLRWIQKETKGERTTMIMGYPGLKEALSYNVSTHRLDVLKQQLFGLVGEEKGKMVLSKITEAAFSQWATARADWVHKDKKDKLIKECVEELKSGESRKQDIQDILTEVFEKQRIFRIYGVENLKVINDFLQDDEYLLKDKNNVRLLINAIALTPAWYGSKGHKQYHLALVFDHEALLSNQYTRKREIWDKINPRQTVSYRPPDHLLGVIVIVPDKQFVQKAINISSHGRGWAHPVFDRNGVVRWPLEKK